MTDYIKRETAIIRAIKHVEDDELADAIVEELKKIPSADVVERKRGEWIAGESWSDGYGMGEQYGRCYVCSECSHVVQDNYRKCSMNFCPNCGANMRIKQIELKK